MDLYTTAAAVIEKFEGKQGSVKSLVFATHYKNIRQLYALVCESLKYQPILTKVFKSCNSLQQEETLKNQTQLAVVLLYEHLLGKGLGRAGKIRSCIQKHKREIGDICQTLLEERGASSLADLLSSQCQALNKLAVPRYVRVNLLKMTVEEAIATFTQEGWQWKGSLGLDVFHTAVESLGEESFAGDPLLWDVLIFPHGTDLHDHHLTESGYIVLQDRASCFPAHVLNPPEGVTVLDCCAAPGNKTSHTASLLNNSGRILAYERDAKRVSLLKEQLKKTGVGNTKAIHQDFLSVNSQDEQFADVEYILVDPSCSGSGIMSRMDHINAEMTNKDSQRLLSLQRFQISILKHALQFPSVRRVVYSTCSVHEEENEAVVREVAQQVDGRFAVKSIFPQFTHRGMGQDAVSERCLRMSPQKDLTNGFFVACFERVETAADPVEEDAGKAIAGDRDQSGTEKEKLVDVQEKKGKKRTRIAEESASNDGNFVQNGDDDNLHEPICHKKKKIKEMSSLTDLVYKNETDPHSNIIPKLGGSEVGPCNDGSVDSPAHDSSVKKMKKKKHKKKKAKGDESIALSQTEHDTEHEMDQGETITTHESSSKKNKKKKKKKKNKRVECDQTSSDNLTVTEDPDNPDNVSEVSRGDSSCVQNVQTSTAQGIDCRTDCEEPQPKRKKKKCKHRHSEPPC